MNKPIAGTIRRRITGQMLYLKLSSLLFTLRILLKVAPPDKEQLERLLDALGQLREKLGVEEEWRHRHAR